MTKLALTALAEPLAFQVTPTAESSPRPYASSSSASSSSSRRDLRFVPWTSGLNAALRDGFWTVEVELVAAAADDEAERAAAVGSSAAGGEADRWRAVGRGLIFFLKNGTEGAEAVDVDASVDVDSAMAWFSVGRGGGEWAGWPGRSRRAAE